MKLIHEHLKNDSAVNSESSSNESSHLQMSSSTTTPTMAPPTGKFLSHCLHSVICCFVPILGSTSHPSSRHSVAKATPQCAVYKVKKKKTLYAFSTCCSIFVPDISWRQREPRPFCSYWSYSKFSRFMFCSTSSAERWSVLVKLL